MASNKHSARRGPGRPRRQLQVRPPVLVEMTKEQYEEAVRRLAVVLREGVALAGEGAEDA